MKQIIRNFGALGLFAVSGLLAHAAHADLQAPLACKENLDGRGYSASVTTDEASAELFMDDSRGHHHLAKLSCKKNSPPPGHQEGIPYLYLYCFDPSTLNGYDLEVDDHGAEGLSKAFIYKEGVDGSNLEARLNCSSA